MVNVDHGELTEICCDFQKTLTTGWALVVWRALIVCQIGAIGCGSKIEDLEVDLFRFFEPAKGGVETRQAAETVGYLRVQLS